jgi:hypothetical protein
MYVHDDARLVYLANPRTGSTSTAKALQDIGFRLEGTHHSGGKVPSGYRTFGVVRNHWDTCVSWVYAVPIVQYHLLKVNQESIEHVLDKLDNPYVTENIMWGLHNLDITLRYEDLPWALNDVLEVWGLPAVKLPRENVSEARKCSHYRTFYDHETREYVNNRFKDEIERLGYKF